MALLLSACAASDAGFGSKAASNNTIKAITVNTTVRPTGQYPESFVITYEKEIEDTGIKAENFSMTGREDDDSLSTTP